MTSVKIAHNTVIVPIHKKTMLQAAISATSLIDACPQRPIRLIRIPYVSDDVGLELPDLTYSFVGRTDGWVNWIPNTGELHYLGEIQIPSDLLNPRKPPPLAVVMS